MAMEIFRQSKYEWKIHFYCIFPNLLKILNKERGLEALKTKNEALEAQIREAQEKYKKELDDLQVSMLDQSGFLQNATIKYIWIDCTQFKSK